MLSRLTKVLVTLPVLSASRSPRYHEMPNGGPGTWMTKTSSPVFGARPLTVIVSFSAKPMLLSLTEALALVAQPAGRPGLRTKLKLNELAACADEASRAPQLTVATNASRRAVRVEVEGAVAANMVCPPLPRGSALPVEPISTPRFLAEPNNTGLGKS